MEDNLRSLKAEQLAAVNLRLLDEGHGGGTSALEDQLGEMVSMREEGLIAGVGISNASLEQVDTAIRLADIVCVQNPFSLVAQDDQPVLARCAAEGIAYVPYFPLGSAFPGAVRVTDQPQVRAVASRLGVTPAQVGLAWLLALSDNILLIPGTSSSIHLRENMATADVVLSGDDLAELSVPSASSSSS